MIKPSIINEDEWQALRALGQDEPVVSAATQQAWHWYNTRVTLISIVVFGYVAILLTMPGLMASKFDVDASMQRLFRDYFILRGLLLLAFGLTGLVSWLKDWHVVKVQGVLLALSLMTFAIDVVLVYGQVPSVPGTGFAMSLLARVVAVGCLAMNVWRAQALPPMSQRKIFCWRLSRRS